MLNEKLEMCNSFSDNIVKIMLGTNAKNGNNIINGVLPDLSWWSDNLETVAHYYNGCVVEISVVLESQEMEYVKNIAELEELQYTQSGYTYGVRCVKYPKGAVWYSFSGHYLQTHIIACKEVFPDLSMFNEEE